ncbi:hypothetical protein [Streptomyces sp. 2133.1]|uniref:hypothetical protein n=1 Tax=Streptomyces sp. 2133.1 TaxID=1881021 RepID=UPI000A6BDBA3|nr:hypothetical protein [Streptomyces sp. 2133.1]
MTNLDAVEGLDAVTRSLARRTPEQLAALLTRHAEPLARRPAPTELRGLAQALWSYETLHHLVLHLDHPRLQVLATTARISQERAGRDAPGPAAPAPGADYQSLMAHRLSFAHLATEPVPPEDVYAALGAAAPGPARSAAESALRHLCDDGLAAPAEDGTIVVPPRAPQLLAAYDLGPFLAHAPQPVPDDTAPGAPAATVPRPRRTTNPGPPRRPSPPPSTGCWPPWRRSPPRCASPAGWPYGRSSGWPRRPAPPNRTPASSSTSRWQPT